MAVLEVSLLTGFHVDETTLDELLGHGHLKLKRYEVEDRKVLLYFDEVFLPFSYWFTVLCTVNAINAHIRRDSVGLG